MPAPLAGVRVVDFGHWVAGPLLAVMLADQGAEVVRIDRPGTPEPRENAFYHRDKRRITLDLKNPEDLAVARKIVTRSDVVVENFRPGVLGRLGLGYEDLRASCPGLVYCSLPGFAAGDPRAGTPAWEGVVDAATGNTRVRAGEAPPGWDGTRPTYSAVPIASNFAAFLGAVGVVSALTERVKSGLGQHVEVPLYDAMFEAIGAAGAFVTAKGLPPERPLASGASGTFRCRDGRYVQFNPIGATRRFVQWFLQAAGKPEWFDETEEAVLRANLADLFASRDAAEWEELGNAAGVPIALIRTGQEWLRTAHARESGEVAAIEDPVLGPTWMPGIAVHTDAEPRLTPRHRPDADRAEILSELTELSGLTGFTGLTDGAAAPVAEVSGARDRPMSGLRVLDLTQILAGPTSGRILGELGTEVVKINALGRRVAVHGVVNRGKQSILLDVQNPAGREVFWKLAETADVIVQNFPTGTAERYGIGYQDVKARRPDLVYVSVSCYGSRGPWAANRGYETQGQAVTGIMARAGGDARPAVLGPYNLLDYGTGVLAAFAATLGLYRRAVTGDGGHFTTSLAQTGTLHQARYLLDYAGKEWNEPAGPGALGEGELQRFHRAADGWFFLGLREDEKDVLTSVMEGRSFADADVATWVEQLRTAGLGAHAVVGIKDLMADEIACARELSITQISEEAGEVRMPGIAIGMSATPPRLGSPARRPGSDVLTVLDHVGLAGALDELERHHAVQTANFPAAWGGP